MAIIHLLRWGSLEDQYILGGSLRMESAKFARGGKERVTEEGHEQLCNYRGRNGGIKGGWLTGGWVLKIK